jgi:hypothetical protein
MTEIIIYVLAGIGGGKVLTIIIDYMVDKFSKK